MKEIGAILGRIILFGTFVWVCARPLSAQVAGGGSMTFEEEMHDFGEVERDGDARWVFQYRNTGTEPLRITNVKCGDPMEAHWSDEAVEPDHEGEIELVYDSHRIGGFRKMCTITSNDSLGDRVIRIKGVILEKAVLRVDSVEVGR